MKAYVDRELCIGCGLCTSIAPDVFAMNADGRAEAVTEHAAALLMTLTRHIHKAASRTRDFNFSLVGLTGFDLHGKTAGIVGTGKIGRIFADRRLFRGRTA